MVLVSIKQQKSLNFILNFKVVANVTSDEHVKSFVKYEYDLKKVQSLLTNMNIHDIGTLNTIKCFAHANFL